MVRFYRVAAADFYNAGASIGAVLEQEKGRHRAGLKIVRS
jgi:hypothetical protein